MLVLLSCVLLSLSAKQNSYSNCTPTTSPLKNIQISVDPQDLTIGSPLTLSANGTISETVTGGTSTLSVQFFQNGAWIRLPDLNFNNCDYVTCPFPSAPGFVSHNISFTIPGTTPPGQYRGAFMILDQSNVNILCVTFLAELLPPNF
uniref:MD-2-related lipid-recognition domain-containing protein n=1 Tax=Arcella intermedia TaxID=1963864 RepID=A0A6B2LNL8_9EUKA